MRPPCPADAFDEPPLRIIGLGTGRLRMRNPAGAAQGRERLRILDAFDHRGRVADERPARRHAGDHPGAVLETSAAHEPGRCSAIRQLREGGVEFVGIDAAIEARAQPYMGAGCRQRVVVAEEIRDQRRITSPAG